MNRDKRAEVHEIAHIDLDGHAWSPTLSEPLMEALEIDLRERGFRAVEVHVLTHVVHIDLVHEEEQAARDARERADDAAIVD